MGGLDQSLFYINKNNCSEGNVIPVEEEKQIEKAEQMPKIQI